MIKNTTTILIIALIISTHNIYASLAHVNNTCMQTEICKNLDFIDINALRMTCKKLSKTLDYNEEPFATAALNMYQKSLSAYMENQDFENFYVLLSLYKHPQQFNFCNAGYYSPLMWVCLDYKRIDALKYLLYYHDIDVHFVNKDNDNLLHQLFLHANDSSMLVTTLKVIIKSRESNVITKIVQQQNYGGYTPLHRLMWRFSHTKHPMPKYLIDLNTVLKIIKLIKPFGANNSVRNAMEQRPTDILYRGTCGLYRPQKDIQAIESALR